MFKKVLLSYLLILLCGFFLAGLLVSSSVKNRLEVQAQDRLRDALITLKPALSGISADIQAMRAIIEDIGPTFDPRIVLIDPMGNILTDSKPSMGKLDNVLELPEIIDARKTGFGRDRRKSIDGGRILCSAIALDVKDPASPYLRMSLTTSDIEKDSDFLTHSVFWTLGIVGFMAAATGFLILRTGLKPIQEIRDVAESIRRGDWSKKAPLDVSGEIGQLCRAINEMSEELSERIEALGAEKGKLETVIRSMEEGVVALNAENKIQHCNESARRMLKLPEDAFSRPIELEIRHPNLLIALNKCRTERSIQQIQIEHGGRFLSLGLYPIQADEGTLLVIRDVTEEAKYETLRKEFVGNVSHELRTPLAMIQGYVETLEDGALENPEHARKFLKIIDRNVHQLKNLVDDLLQLSKVESQVGEPALASLAAKPLLEDLISSLDSLAQAKNQKLNLEAEGLLPNVLADEQLLDRALRNLVENAIKYTPEGGKVSAKVMKEGHFLRFDVSDTGIGIPPESQNRIFERFYRVDKSRSREVGGTGLGLSIVKHIAQLHQGQITVKSEFGKGSTFSLLIPIAR